MVVGSPEAHAKFILYKYHLRERTLLKQFYKLTINIVVCLDTCLPVCFKLCMMLDSTKLDARLN